MVRTFLALSLLAGFVALIGSCRTPGHVGTTSRVPQRPPLASEIAGEPAIRVRIAADQQQVVIAAGSPLVIGPIDSQHRLTRPRSFLPPVTIDRRGDGFLLTDGQGKSFAWRLPALKIAAASPTVSLAVDGQVYPGDIVVWPVVHEGLPTGGMDVVNHVPMERYLPGVLQRELYGDWPLETFVAQAIAARTYALAEKSLREDQHYDLTSTTASQVYGGEATNPTAIEAVRRTRGLVLAYQGRIIPAYFSSCSGGVGQDATAAFPDSPWVVDIAPLRGRTHGWGQSSPNFHWGPIARDAGALSRRIAAWGRSKRNAVAHLGELARVDVVARGSTGRPAVFRLTDTRGQRFDLPAEWFRFACNYTGGGIGPVDAAHQLKSSNVHVQVRGRQVLFTHGRGYGHGVGLCQWSARDMAAAGYSGRAIVEFFYPGAVITRIY